MSSSSRSAVGTRGIRPRLEAWPVTRAASGWMRVRTTGRPTIPQRRARATSAWYQPPGRHEYPRRRPVTGRRPARHRGMQRRGSLVVLSLILVAACASGPGTPVPDGTASASARATGPAASGSNGPSAAPVPVPAARLLFRRTTATSDGRTHALLLLDPASADLAQSPDRGAREDARHVEWSPDGTRLLAWANGDDETTLLVIPVDGSEVVRIGGDARLTWDRAWSPDGRSIAFSRNATQRPGVRSLRAARPVPSEIVVAAADGPRSRWWPKASCRAGRPTVAASHPSAAIRPGPTRCG